MINENTGEDVTCPFCGEINCSHLMAIVDESFDEWFETGYLFDRVGEVWGLIEEAFRRRLQAGAQTPLANPELDQLWREVQEDLSNAQETSASEYSPEIGLDLIAFNRLLIELLAKAGAVKQDATDGFAPGFTSCMTVLYAKDPARVFNAALEELKQLLA